MYDVNEKKSWLKSINKGYQDRIQRKKKRKCMNDETSRGDSELYYHQTYKIKTFLVIIDRLNGNTEKTNICLWTSMWKFWFFLI